MRRLLDEGAPAIHKVAREIAARAPRPVLPAARATSGDAAPPRQIPPRSPNAPRALAKVAETH
ncbi:hypothetical protein ACGFXB_04285 [Streptomyces canus]|uniref:hypothetical protein n=1 Tax=Streptomyces canus TaxID=58343 RepID=UPI003719F6A2